MNHVLIITSADELGVNNVLTQLSLLGQAYVVITVEDLMRGNAELIQQLNGVNFTFSIRIAALSLELSDITSVWYRRPNFGMQTAKKHVLDGENFAAGEWKYFTHTLCTIMPGYWINNPIWGSYLLEHNKILQMKLAAEVGLSIPDSIVTNSYSQLAEFCDNHEDDIACKAIHSRIFFDESDTAFGIYTQRINRARLDVGKETVRYAPVLAQAYINKLIELRITIIGHHVFCCAIHSQDSVKTKHDWRRYDFEKVKHEVHTLPEDIVAKLLYFMRQCKLNFGAIDMILTPQGEYVFLEVNPSGQYGWIEGLTGMPIAATIAKSLMSPIENGLIFTQLL